MALALDADLHLRIWSLLSTTLYRCIGISLDNSLSLHQHVMNVCRVAYLELRQINSIRNLLSINALKTIVYSLVLSRIVYYNSLLVGLPQYFIKRLQGVQNTAARSILRTPRSEHISAPPEHSLAT